MVTSHSSSKQNGSPIVSIVGAGIAGISAAIALKTQLGYENFIIYEKANEIGGTWRDNTYPGCGSDIRAHWYSLSTELNPDWKSSYALQPEILSYWKSVFAKHKLDKYLVCNTFARFARWDNARQAYELTVEDVRTGERRSEFTEILVWSVGGFTGPIYPDIPGIDVFKGHMWHSARWNHDVPLSGKRIGFIGNGCSSAQIVPELAKDPTVQIVNFCRTPQWYYPRLQSDYSTVVKWIFRNVPFVLRWYRNYIMINSEINYLFFTKRSPPALLRRVRNNMENYIRKTAPKEYHEMLIPKYTPGCRRVILDQDYLKCLHKPNVDLCWEGIDAIVEDGIRLKSGVVFPLDVIILGTGYSIWDCGLDLQGRDGRTLTGYFNSKNGASAYLGTSVPGFPNLFMLMGPNTISTTGSVVFTEEVQIQYALRLIKPVIDGLAASFEVRDEDTDAYNERLQRSLSTSVTLDCTSYYRKNHTGKNYVVFPGMVSLFYWFGRKTRWECYKVVNGEKWESQRRNLEWKKGLMIGTFGMALVATFLSAVLTKARN